MLARLLFASCQTMGRLLLGGHLLDRLMTRLAWCAAGRKLAVLLCMGSIRACSMIGPERWWKRAASAAL
jgi:hypothetical protein